MSQFQWHTEDDVDWDEIAKEPTPPPKPSKRRRWLLVLAVLVLAFGAGAMIWREVAQRVEENTQATKGDVISSYNLVQLAAAEQDGELFISLLSGRNSSWTDAQQTLFRSELLFDRAPFGMHTIETDRTFTAEPAEEPLVELSPDLSAAEVTTIRPYAIAVGNGITETVSLEQTSIYRRGSDRWLLSPPEEAFWGGSERREGIRLALSYPERDAAWAARLLPDLEAKLTEACSNIEGLSCPANLLLSIDLSTNPATLAALETLPRVEEENETLRLALPAPTLVGIPTDEGAYQALFRGYAAQAVTALAAYSLDYRCCSHLPFFQALMDYQLAELGLRPWPVQDEDYRRVLEEQVRLDHLSTLWGSNDLSDLRGPEGWKLYTALDFLLAAFPEESALQMQQELSQGNTYFGWLNRLFAGTNGPTNAPLLSQLSRRWWLAAYPTAVPVGDITTANIDQDLQLLCVVPNASSPDIQDAALYRLDVVAGEWTQEQQTDSFVFIYPLPGDGAVVLQEFGFEDQRWQTRLWQDGSGQFIMPPNEDYSISLGQTDPSGRSLLAYVFPSGAEEATITLFDLDTCTDTGCNTAILPGLPSWSPAGTRALFMEDPNLQVSLLQFGNRIVHLGGNEGNLSSRLYLGDRARIASENITDIGQLEPVGTGYAPFWLDEETYGFISAGQRQFSQPGQAVLIANVGNHDAQTLVTMEQLLEAVPEEVPTSRLWWIRYAAVHPQDPNQIFLVVFDNAQQLAQVFLFRRDSNEVERLLEIGYRANHSLGFSPDGRYLVLTGIDNQSADNTDENALLLLYDLQERDTMPFLTTAIRFPPFLGYDWSGDGHWLSLMADHDLLALYAPADNQLQFTPTAFGNCSSPAWVNR